MPVAITDCPHCAARDTVVLETGEHFCPWCLYSWSNLDTLMLGPGSKGQDGYLEDLERAFESD